MLRILAWDTGKRHALWIWKRKHLTSISDTYLIVMTRASLRMQLTLGSAMERWEKKA